MKMGKAELNMVFDGNDCFIQLDDGTRLAKRENGAWVQLHPNWIVSTDADHEHITAEWIPDAGQA